MVGDDRLRGASPCSRAPSEQTEYPKLGLEVAYGKETKRSCVLVDDFTDLNLVDSQPNVT